MPFLVSKPATALFGMMKTTSIRNVYCIYFSGSEDQEKPLMNLWFRHVMCEYIQSLLPVTTPKTVRNYSKMMTEHGAQKVEPTEVFSSDINQASADAEFAVDIHHLKERLDKRDQQVLKYILLGYSFAEIGKEMTMPKVTLNRAKQRIGRQYNQYMGGRYGKFD